MESSFLTAVLLPASLFIIMLGMGLSLVVDDFKRIVLHPKAVLLGLVNQLIVLPLIAFGITIAMNLPTELAIGMMLLASCPGGVTSNLISHVSRGDTALSISLTAVSSFITLLTIPLYVGFAFRYFSEAGHVVDVDEAGMILQILVIVIIPVMLGMLIRKKREAFALRMDKPVRIISTVLFVLILLSIIISERELIWSSLADVGLATGTLNVITMLIGYFSARAFRLDLRQAITIAIESGIQNGTLAIVMATTVLANAALSIPAAVYGLLMFVTGGFMMYYFGRKGGMEEGTSA
ncbi:MAG: bile acid:sodium symporter family protein [Saprospiraceae bacterium]|nr:bile acid:sodium symporter family protein [Saprospiraceae bacterium]